MRCASVAVKQPLPQGSCACLPWGSPPSVLEEFCTSFGMGD